MTNEEALKYIQRKSKLMATVPRSTVEGTEAFNACEFFKVAAKALVNEEKYRWHDLRKNPNDLPEEGITVLVCIKLSEEDGDYWYREVPNARGKIIHKFFIGKEILAWKYIEPFEVEE